MKNKTLILTTVMCLLPILLGLALYDQLPVLVPIHFDMHGTPDNYAPKAMAVFGLPIFMAAMNAVLHLAMRKDQRTMEASPKVLIHLTGWIPAILSLILMPITLFMAMGVEIPIVLIVSLLVGFVFVAVGNYLPKCQPNRYMGIKLPWTFASEENWRKTHRFGGFVWVVSGILIILSAIINWPWVQLVALFASILLPTIYSWNYARKEK